jgi:hypothetical protein
MLSCLLERMACMERALQELNMTLVSSSNSSSAPVAANHALKSMQQRQAT